MGGVTLLYLQDCMYAYQFHAKLIDCYLSVRQCAKLRIRSLRPATRQLNLSKKLHIPQNSSVQFLFHAIDSLFSSPLYFEPRLCGELPDSGQRRRPKLAWLLRFFLSLEK
jgi:hypothetical protein